jgi:hypothetical protein
MLKEIDARAINGYPQAILAVLLFIPPFTSHDEYPCRKCIFAIRSQSFPGCHFLFPENIGGAVQRAENTSSLDVFSSCPFRCD